MSDVQMNERIAIDILEQLPTPVMAVDLDMNIIFMNASGRNLLGKTMEELRKVRCADIMNSNHCGKADCRMRSAIENDEMCSARNEINIGGRVIPIEYYAAPLKDENGRIVGGLEYIHDITERVRYENKLMEQSRTIREISTPAIKLWDRIVVLPVVGVIDSMRAQQMMETMLTKITETSSKVIILDIQGVAAVDTAVANHLIKITKATKLMGCRCIISGISSAVAQTLVQLGIDLGDVITHSTLQDALAEAFHILNLQVARTK